MGATFRWDCTAVILLFACVGSVPGAEPSTAPADNPQSRLERLVRELRNAGQPVDAAGLRMWRELPDEQNAARTLDSLAEQISGSLRRREHPFQRGPDAPDQGPLTDAHRHELRQVLARQRVLLEQVDRMDAMEGFDWGERPRSPAALHPSRPLHELAYVVLAEGLRLDAVEAIDAGDWARAIRRLDQLQRMAEGLSLQPGFRLVFIIRRTDLAAVDVARQLAAAGMPPDARGVGRVRLLRAIQSLIEDAPARRRLARSLRSERAIFIDSFTSLAAGKAGWPELQESPDLIRFVASARIAQSGGDVIVDWFGRSIAVVEAAGAFDAPLCWSIGEAARDAAGNRMDGRLAMQAILMRLSQYTRDMVEVQAHRKLAGVALAVSLYRHEHDGAWPVDLDALVPGWLEAMPADPQSNTPSLIRYRRTESGAVLWTSGVNGEDDGGSGDDVLMTIDPWQRPARE